MTERPEPYAAPLTPERLDEIRARADAATPGEWGRLGPIQAVVLAPFRSDGTPDEDATTSTIGLLVGPTDGAVAAVSITVLAELPDRDDVGNDPLWRDADFIAHARQDVPDLLAAIDALTARAEAAEQIVAKVSRLVHHPSMTDTDGQCIGCWSYVGGKRPEGHSVLCPIEAIRSMVGELPVPAGRDGAA